MSKYNPPAYPQATYDAGPYNPAGSPPPGQYYQAPPPAQQGYYGAPPQQGPYGGPPQQYGGPPPQQGMYYQQGPPQGGYVDNRGRKGGMGGESCLAGCLGALACCCCLDFLF